MCNMAGWAQKAEKNGRDSIMVAYLGGKCKLIIHSSFRSQGNLPLVVSACRQAVE
jgi:hypothetical protein